MLRTLNALHALSPWIVLSIATAVLVFDGAAQPAAAQNFFQQLFGAPKPKPRVIYKPRRPSNVRVPQQTLPFGGSTYSLFAPPQKGQPKPRRSYSPRYRTVCVRMCDGYYFPISFATRKNHLSRDREMCARRCPGQGQLFYMRSPSGTMEHAVDMKGRRYEKLKIAYRYRKTLVSGCACRAAPWSAQQRLRHAMYRSTATPLGSGRPTGKAVAGTYDGSTATKPVTKKKRHMRNARRRKRLAKRPLIRGTVGATSAVIGGHPFVSEAVSLYVPGPLTDLRTFEKFEDETQLNFTTRGALAAARRREDRLRERPKPRPRKVAGPVAQRKPVNRIRRPSRRKKTTPALFGAAGGGGSTLRFPGD